MTKRATLTEQVYDGILGLVIDGSFPIGTRLPPEVELCRNYGASRPVVREVLARLRAEGLIESRRGSGSYVLRQTAASPQLPEGVGEGDGVSFTNGGQGVILEVTAESFRVDANHRLAGQALTFEIELMSIE